MEKDIKVIYDRLREMREKLDSPRISAYESTNPFDAEYANLLHRILKNGKVKLDRTGTGTIEVFGHQMRFDLSKGFPCLTTKKLHLKSIIYELLWFLRGETNIKYLNDHGVTIWDEWADENGELGPVYGSQWRSWPAPNGKNIDQIQNIIKSLKNTPNGRRHIVSAWNPAEIENMALPPCHCLFQFDVLEGALSCQLYQRSCDVFLGVPFNIASYALLMMMVAQVCGYELGEFIWTGGDCHLYLNHLEQAQIQMARMPYLPPQMRITPEVNDIFNFRYEDFELQDYEAHPHIKGAISV